MSVAPGLGALLSTKVKLACVPNPESQPGKKSKKKLFAPISKPLILPLSPLTGRVT